MTRKPVVPETYAEAQYLRGGGPAEVRWLVSTMAGDRDRAAEYLARIVRVGGIRRCREIVDAALQILEAAEQEGVQP